MPVVAAALLLEKGRRDMLATRNALAVLFNRAPPPTYMTVGNGSTSDSATALMSSLNHDSGYGGSIASGSTMDGSESRGWDSNLMEDRPTPGHTPTHPGEWNPAGLSPCSRMNHFVDGLANVLSL